MIGLQGRVSANAAQWALQQAMAGAALAAAHTSREYLGRREVDGARVSRRKRFKSRMAVYQAMQKAPLWLARLVGQYAGGQVMETGDDGQRRDQFVLSLQRQQQGPRPGLASQQRFGPGPWPTGGYVQQPRLVAPQRGGPGVPSTVPRVASTQSVDGAVAPDYDLTDTKWVMDLLASFWTMRNVVCDVVAGDAGGRVGHQPGQQPQQQQQQQEGHVQGPPGAVPSPGHDDYAGVAAQICAVLTQHLPLGAGGASDGAVMRRPAFDRRLALDYIDPGPFLWLLSQTATR